MGVDKPENAGIFRAMDHELDDGATEAVTDRPSRRHPLARDVLEAAQAPSGGKLAMVRHLGDEARREFISLRLPAGAARISFSHLPVFKALWRLTMQKRAAGEMDGVTVAEIARESGLTLTKVQTIIVTLRKSQIIRSVKQHVGWAKVLGHYFPTELGTQLLALAEFLGPNASVQVGRTQAAWSGRSKSEPENFFRHADLLRGT